MKHWLVAGATFFTATISAQKHQLVKKWESDSLFKVPESALFDADHHTLYITNIEGNDFWAKDGLGSIGKMNTDGSIIDAEWITGFNAPRGMSLYSHSLFVADIDRIVVVDVHQGRISHSIDIPGASGLNDLAIDATGIIYVADSKGKKIYRIEKGTPAVFLENLKGPNGLLIRGAELFYVDAGSFYKIGPDHKPVLIASGMETTTDGIVHAGGDDFIISCWIGAIWYITADGTKQKLLDSQQEKINSADIGFDPATRTLFVPTFWKNTIVAYEVK